MERRGYLITGRVQGVGYRAFVRRAARGLGLAGWVCNHPDGSVELLAEGPAAALDALECQLQQGPAAATVAAVSCQPASFAEHFAGGDSEIRFG
jgi:acylphosphatase